MSVRDLLDQARSKAYIFLHQHLVIEFNIRGLWKQIRWEVCAVPLFTGAAVCPPCHPGTFSTSVGNLSQYAISSRNEERFLFPASTSPNLYNFTSFLKITWVDFPMVIHSNSDGETQVRDRLLLSDCWQTTIVARLNQHACVYCVLARKVLKRIRCSLLAPAGPHWQHQTLSAKGVVYWFLWQH